MEKKAERVVEFLSRCSDPDIEAGIGSLLGHGDERRIAEFMDGIRRAIEGE